MKLVFQGLQPRKIFRKLFGTASWTLFLPLFLPLAGLFLSGGNSEFLDNGSGFLPRILLFGLFATFLSLGAITIPSLGTVSILIYLVLFGLLRRLLVPGLGYQENDPLVLVGPIVATIIALRLVYLRQVSTRSPANRLIIVILVMMMFAIVNPFGSAGLVGNLSGAIFYMVPLFWYLYGNRVATPQIMRTLQNGVMAIGIVVSLYGLYQTIFGFTETDLLWMSLTRYSQVLTQDTARVFSTFNGFAEYTEFVGTGCVFAWARFISGKRPYIFLAALFFAAVVLSSGRGILLNTIAGCVVVSAVRGKTVQSWIPRLVLVAVLAIGGTVAGLQRVKETAPVNSTIGRYVGHQTKILEPTVTQTGSGAAHITLFRESFVYGITHPFGRGLAAGTIAESKITANKEWGAEFDLGNMFHAIGMVGGIPYFILCVICFYQTARLWHVYRNEIFLLILGMLVVDIGQWLTGGLYSAAFLIWFSLGFVIRASLALPGALPRTRARQTRVSPRTPPPRENIQATDPDPAVA